MVWHDKMGIFTDEQVVVELEPAFFKPTISSIRAAVYDDPVSDNALFALMQNSGGNQVQDKLILPDHHSVARVMATLVARNDIRSLGQQVNNFSFPFITPLGTDEINTGIMTPSANPYSGYAIRAAIS